MNKTIVAVIVSLIIGFAGGSYVGTAKAPGGAHVMPDGSVMGNEMADMMAGLSGKTGDEFDKAFLTEMIVHHEGAVDMAKSVLINAKHSELKTMANAIITAQTGEIEQMKTWLSLWYGIK